MPALLTALLAPAHAAAARSHRMAFQISTSDADLMNLILNNLGAAATHYAGLDETVELELVAFGPGLHMLRDDTSPVQARLTELRARLPALVMSACSNTRHGMEASEHKHIEVVSGARWVPSGVVRLSELQELGWSYLRS